MGVRWYPGALEAIDASARKALEKTAEALKTDLIQSQTLPRWTGELQDSVFVDRTQSWRGKVSIVTNTPYARRLYYHPEYDFWQGFNEKAGGMWYEPYKKGKKKQWVISTYKKFLKGQM